MINVEWDGVGLPPVGCKCEFSFHNGYEQVAIVAHVADLNSSTKAVFQGIKQWGYSSELSLFRPIKSERDKAIEEIGKNFIDMESMFVSGHAAKLLAEHIYDAGYRKVEQ